MLMTYNPQHRLQLLCPWYSNFHVQRARIAVFIEFEFPRLLLRPPFLNNSIRVRIFNRQVHQLLNKKYQVRIAVYELLSINCNWRIHRVWIATLTKRVRCCMWEHQWLYYLPGMLVGVWHCQKKLNVGPMRCGSCCLIQVHARCRLDSKLLYVIHWWRSRHSHGREILYNDVERMIWGMWCCGEDDMQLSE